MKFIYRLFATKFKLSTINSLVCDGSHISRLRTFDGEGSKNIGFGVNANVMGCFKILT
jgi:hypothetical protein